MSEIAIIGLGCVFPGAASPAAYWRNLLEKRDGATPLSSAELGVDPARYYDPTPGTPDRICYNRNGHVRDFHFDATGYQVPAEELHALDALFQWTIHAADQALEDSGYNSAEHEQVLHRCGLIVGNIGMPTHSGKRLLAGFYHRILEPYIRELLGEPQFRFADYWNAQELSELNLMTGSHNATIAALALGLRGPSFAVDAACASALYAIHIASDYLLSGKADLMLAGAVCHADHIYVDHGFNVLKAFPETGASIPFDRASQGLKAGEGSGVVALKRYEDACRDGDRIYGVIQSIGLSNDGGAKHVLVPDTSGQLLSLQRAYARTASDIDYLECHATGTPLGDQVELRSVEAFFGARGHAPLLGANKANNGHMLTASGMGSILKVLLAMQHGVIPPTLGVEELVETPRGWLTIDHIVRETIAWPTRAGGRRAGINAFGFGGVNGHMVLREHVDAPLGRVAAGKTPSVNADVEIGIVGMAVALADTLSVDTFKENILNGSELCGDLPRTRWLGIETRPDIVVQRGAAVAPKGAYIEKFSFDCKRYKLPPKVMGSHLLSHAYLMPVAERAFVDAGYVLDGAKRNIAVIVAGDVDYSCLRYQARNEISWQIRDSLSRSSIALSSEQSAALESIVKDSLFPEPFPEGITGGVGNVVASRIAAYLKLDGPAFYLCSHESSVFKGLQIAQFMLSSGLVEAVIVAARSFAGGPENVLWGHRRLYGGMTQPVGEGGGVVVLKRAQDARQSGNRIYAIIKGLQIAHDSEPRTAYEPTSALVAQTAQGCLKSFHVDASDIDYIECHAGSLTERRAEAEGLASVYGFAARAAVPVIGSVKVNYGHLCSAAGILSLIKTSLCLYHRFLPATPAPEMLGDLYSGQAFAVRRESEQWAQPRGVLRKAAISSLGVDRACAHLILEEPREEDRSIAVPNVAPDTAHDDGSVLTTIYVGRERTIEEIILDASTRALFRKPGQPRGSEFQQRQLMRNAQTQFHYLRAQQDFYGRLKALFALRDAVQVGQAVVFDEQQLIELTDGSVARVLGPAYLEADSYAIRTRMPSWPYRFVSRITALTARRGVLEPCYIEWEYDLPHDAWYVCDGRVPAFVALESSHAMIVAFTCIGCDELFKGELRYRAVDSQTTVYDEMPRAGEVLRGRVDIKSFLKVGRNILISYEYVCYADQRLVLKLVANSGFFLPKDMERAKGVDASSYLRYDGPARSFRPPLRCAKNVFDADAVAAMQRGDFADCFGPDYRAAARLRLPAPVAKMLDRIISVDPGAGPFGLGVILGERDIDPSHWVFKAHFKNDPVMPGTFLIEGCEQVMNFYLAYLGLYSQPGLVARELTQHHYNAKFRGEVKCEPGTVRFCLTCKSIDCRYEPDGVTLADVSLVFVAEILYRDNVIGICNNLGAQFSRTQPARAMLNDLAQFEGSIT